MWSRGVALVVVGASISLSGCGLQLPVSTSSSAGQSSSPVVTTARSSTVRAKTAKSRVALATTSAASRATGLNGSASAAAVVRAFATTYINWNAEDFASLLERLGNSSTGQAQETMLLDAAEVARDSSLRADGISNSGTVEAVAPIAGDPVDRYVVVTYEQTKSTKSSAYAGVGPSWHVTLATVAPVGGRWVVSDWQPES